jgi:hypothetical protein
MHGQILADGLLLEFFGTLAEAVAFFNESIDADLAAVILLYSLFFNTLYCDFQLRNTSLEETMLLYHYSVIVLFFGEFLLNGH